MNGEFRQLLALAPAAPDWHIDWESIERSSLFPLLGRLSAVPQEKKWHGEGDVLAHTKLVIQALAGLEEYRMLPRHRQELLFMAALLHDIGKIPATREEDGRIVSPRHSEVGSRMARETLFTQFGVCGTKEDQLLREAVCRLIRWHMAPEHMLEGSNSQVKMRRIAAEGELVSDFTLRMLCILAEADARGRICDDLDEMLESIELCRVYAQEAGCFDGPAAFESEYTKRAFFSGRNVQPDQMLYDDTWGEVILLCALPGTGKDTWIRCVHPQAETVSLDDMRDEMGVSPTDNQGAVAQACKEKARQYLRAHKPFAFNATNLTPLTREPLVSLFESYGARVRIVYLETGWEEELRRNSQRKKAVPEAVIASMLSRLSVPERAEAQYVEWICV